MSWQKELSEGFSSVNELLKFLDLPLELGSAAAEKIFKTRLPRNFAVKIQPKNPNDPILLQALATAHELNSEDGFTDDPLKETELPTIIAKNMRAEEHKVLDKHLVFKKVAKQNAIPGLLHKYYGRVLLLLTGACAINCRYCFRRHFPYKDNNPRQDNWQAILNYIKNDSSIHEVILSGGDPLLADNLILKDLFLKLETISHVHTIRIHSRMPIVLPTRIDEGLLSLLSTTRFHKVIVMHTNHAQELDGSVEKICRLLKQVNCLLLSQSVLLKNVNDNAKTLATLSESLFSYGIMPYYLFLLDKVSGASHFDIPKKQALKIYRELQTILPGYLVPKFAYEIPNKKNKTLVC